MLPPLCKLVATCYNYLARSGFTAHHVDARVTLVYAIRHTANGSLCVGLDFSFSFGSTIPRTEEETTILDALLKFIVVVAFKGVVFKTLLKKRKNVLLNFFQQILYVLFDAFKWECLFFKRVATHHFNCTIL